MVLIWKISGPFQIFKIFLFGGGGLCGIGLLGRSYAYKLLPKFTWTEMRASKLLGCFDEMRIWKRLFPSVACPRPPFYLFWGLLSNEAETLWLYIAKSRTCAISNAIATSRLRNTVAGTDPMSDVFRSCDTLANVWISRRSWAIPSERLSCLAFLLSWTRRDMQMWIIFRFIFIVVWNEITLSRKRFNSLVFSLIFQCVATRPAHGIDPDWESEGLDPQLCYNLVYFVLTIFPLDKGVRLEGYRKSAYSPDTKWIK
jgi:hypothetical protein